MIARMPDWPARPSSVGSKPSRPSTSVWLSAAVGRGLRRGPSRQHLLDFLGHRRLELGRHPVVGAVRFARHVASQPPARYWTTISLNSTASTLAGATAVLTRRSSSSFSR